MTQGLLFSSLSALTTLTGHDAESDSDTLTDPLPLVPLDDLPLLDNRAAELVVDRLESAWAEGLLRLTPDQYCDVLTALMPDDFVVRPPTTLPSTGAAGTTQRIADYAVRGARQEPVVRGDDVLPLGKRSLRAEMRSNGKGWRVLGWGDVGDDDTPAIRPGMYRDAAGRWYSLG